MNPQIGLNSMLVCVLCYTTVEDTLSFLLAQKTKLAFAATFSPAYYILIIIYSQLLLINRHTRCSVTRTAVAHDTRSPKDQRHLFHCLRRYSHCYSQDFPGATNTGITKVLLLVHLSACSDDKWARVNCGDAARGNQGC